MLLSLIKGTVSQELKVGIAIDQSKAFFKCHCRPSYNCNCINGILRNFQKKIKNRGHLNKALWYSQDSRIHNYTMYVPEFLKKMMY